MTDCTTRLPFRFGISTLTFAPMCTAGVTIESEDGRVARGFSAELLVPKWFEKVPEQSAETDIARLLASAEAAARQALASPDDLTVFEHWRRIHAACVPDDARDGLLRGFGVALIERAIIDAACRAAGVSFFDGVRGGLLGFDAGEVHADLAPWRPADLPAPRTRVRVRHTVGLLDSIRRDDVPADERRDDGLPESLDEDIDRYGLTHFKIKVGGDRAADLDRLRRIGEVIAEKVAAPRITLDGNEQYTDMDELAALLRALEADEVGRRLLSWLLHIEQPIARANSFDPAATRAIDQVTAFAPVIIDEADAGLHAFERAAKCGYRGISVKNCKGVFRSLVHKARCDLSGGRLFQSAEDLTNLPVLPLQQDLATVALLGLDHVERNGHHYFHGLDHLPGVEVEAALAHHPDLYAPLGSGAQLRIEDGEIRCESLACPGYGHRGDIAEAARTPAQRWRWPASHTRT
ncbi:MAG: enolase C-terminal domain-like protein [Planctomycetota bacterium]